MGVLLLYLYPPAVTGLSQRCHSFVIPAFGTAVRPSYPTIKINSSCDLISKTTSPNSDDVLTGLLLPLPLGVPAGMLREGQGEGFRRDWTQFRNLTTQVITVVQAAAL